MAKNIKLIIATHKKYDMPKSDIYLPLQVGAEGKEKLGYEVDSSMDNISEKNPYYCELTGLYWAWKNLDADYIGLVHYRRHFASKEKISSKKRIDRVLTEEEARKILETSDVVLPKKRNYYIENLYSHYEHTMFIEPLEITRKKRPDLL